jgi:hypothetical protein
MKISLRELHRRQPVPRLVIHSLDQALYSLTAELDGRSVLVTESDGRPLRRHSLTAMRAALELLNIDELVLRQESAYDEMVGQPLREGSNAMEIVLGKALYPDLTRH